MDCIRELLMHVANKCGGSEIPWNTWHGMSIVSYHQPQQ
jgi:hypothetical protein